MLLDFYPLLSTKKMFSPDELEMRVTTLSNWPIRLFKINHLEMFSIHLISYGRHHGSYNLQRGKNSSVGYFYTTKYSPDHYWLVRG